MDDTMERIRLWILMHRIITALLGLFLVAGLVGVGIGVRNIFRPLDCGSGMTVAGSPPTCVGLDLESKAFSDFESKALRSLQQRIHADNAKITDPYVSLVLLLNMSPVTAVDTESEAHVAHAVEGAITAAWRANHTGALGGGLHIKLLLANMGSQYAFWRRAVDEIHNRAKSQHIAAVVGFGQSNIQNRSAAAALSKEAHLPVIGATVTADSMNRGPDGGRISSFFRVSSTNADAAKAAKQYLAQHRSTASPVAIVEDKAEGDDYTTTLANDAEAALGNVPVHPYSAPATLPSGVRRDEYLSQQFSLLHNNLCQNPPSTVFFAGRGHDLGTFINSWVQDGTCGGPLTVITGDDGSSAIGVDAVEQAVEKNDVKVLYAATGSPDEWGGCPAAGSRPSPAKKNYDQFLSVFTGKPDPCTQVRFGSNDHTASLDFNPQDLSNADAMLTHDAIAAAVIAARNDQNLVLRDPESLVGVLHQITCSNMVPGASGWIAFDDDGNAIDKPIPLLQINANDQKPTSLIKLIWPETTPLLSLPIKGQQGVPGC